YGALQVMGPLGQGIGSTGGAAAAIMGTSDFWWLEGLFEDETARVLQETGIIGFVLVYAARVWLFVKAISLGLRFRTPLYVALSGVIAALFLTEMISTIINNPTVGIYYWFAAGLLFAMYRLEMEATKIQQWQKTYYYSTATGVPAT